MFPRAVSTKLTLAPSLARSHRSLPFRNFIFVPCLPMFGHLVLLNLPILDQLSAFKSRIRVNNTSKDTPKKSCPTITSGSDL